MKTRQIENTIETLMLEEMTPEEREQYLSHRKLKDAHQDQEKSLTEWRKDRRSGFWWSVLYVYLFVQAYAFAGWLLAWIPALCFVWCCLKGINAGQAIRKATAAQPHIEMSPEQRDLHNRARTLGG